MLSFHGTLIAVLSTLAISTSELLAESLAYIVFDPSSGEVTRLSSGQEMSTEPIARIDGEAWLGEPETFVIEDALLEQFVAAKPAFPTYEAEPDFDLSMFLDFGIVGTDNREPVLETFGFPSNAVVHILYKVTQFQGVCSGALISDDTVLTAGHCVHGPSGWHTGYVVHPGRNGAIYHYSSCGVSKVMALQGWIDTASRPFDLAALKLDCTIGAKTGSFGVIETPETIGVALTVQGYPGEPQFLGRQFRSVDSIRRLHELYIDHEADTTKGMSGAPVYDEDRNVIAVHTGTTPAEGWSIDNQRAVVNHATRITAERLALIRSWIEM